MHSCPRTMNSRRRRHASGLHTTSYVLVETMALRQRRTGREGLRTFVADMLPVVQVIWVDEGIHRSAQHALLVASRRDLSLVDCVSFEVMRQRGIRKAFAFDTHFAEQGFDVTP